MKYTMIYFLLLFMLCACQPEEMPTETVNSCNGSAALCDKKYNEVVFACTHNAYNYPSEPANFLLPNQNQSIKQQLDDGIRALMLDIYFEDETVWLYHGTKLVGFSSLVDELSVISQFLKDNPNEIITIILECYVAFPEFKKTMEESSLIPYLYIPQSNGNWLTLQQMIESNQRLVILSDVNDKDADDWYMYVWDVAFETHYDITSNTDFTCNTNRGNSNNDLFIFNHFITHAIIGTGLIDSSLMINQYDYLLNRVTECQSYYSQIPNFITVDFYDAGDVLEVVNYMNEAL